MRETDNVRKRADRARSHARRAVFELARDQGAQLVTRPVFPGADITTRDVRELAGATAARDLEYAARATARSYIRLAREAGCSWEQIGQALGVQPGADADQAGMTVAEAAYTYAAGQPESDAPWRPRSFTWTCRSCDQTISDHGLIAGPAEDETGHAARCQRQADAIAAWDAQWDGGWEPQP